MYHASFHQNAFIVQCQGPCLEERVAMPDVAWGCQAAHTLTQDYKYGQEVSVDDCPDDAKAKAELPKSIYRNNIKSPSLDYSDLPSKGYEVATHGSSNC